MNVNEGGIVKRENPVEEDWEIKRYSSKKDNGMSHKKVKEKEKE